MLENKLHLFTLILFLALLFITYLVPISDIDFWWHIATGRYILETGSIPSVDPFLVFDNSDSIRSSTILKGYWLGQVALFMVYDHFSNLGMMVFRSLILIACVALIYVRMGMLNLEGLSVWLSLLIAALVLQGFTGDRPQLFSFLFLGLLMLLWDGFQYQKNRLWLIPFPVIFALWSNIHGGFLLGIAVVGLLVVVEALSALRTKERVFNLLAWGGFMASMVLASMFNPSHINTYLLLFKAQGSEAQNRTSEYISSLSIYRFDMWYEQTIAVAFFMVALFAIAYAIKKRSWDKALVMGFLMLISLDAYRYLAFFAIVATPYIAQSLFVVETRVTSSIGNFDKWLRWCSFLTVSVLLSAYVLWHQPIQTNDRFAELNQGLMKIKQKQGTGYTFNTMNIGGYLIWHLAPDIRTFIDGRLLDEKKLLLYTHMLWTTEYGRKWFDQARFDWVIMSTKNQFTGESYSLVPYLLGQGKWDVSFRTDDWIILERN